MYGKVFWFRVQRPLMTKCKQKYNFFTALDFLMGQWQWASPLCTLLSTSLLREKPSLEHGRGLSWSSLVSEPGVYGLDLWGVTTKWQLHLLFALTPLYNTWFRVNIGIWTPCLQKLLCISILVSWNHEFKSEWAGFLYRPVTSDKHHTGPFAMGYIFTREWRQHPDIFERKCL